eukprot:TRINITY_DN888_c0_g1_i8.p2 TRINITY_DN888_c0_g1~~TRINITY_DN888_c0_g1_i8.p2  ORF type:complete len:109 (-),score=29.22 TRINITY_DN888_c0_g1_i8:137-463(-)
MTKGIRGLTKSPVKKKLGGSPCSDFGFKERFGVKKTIPQEQTPQVDATNCSSEAKGKSEKEVDNFTEMIKQVSKKQKELDSDESTPTFRKPLLKSSNIAEDSVDMSKT